MGTAFLRTIILYVVVVIAVRIMGKRQIGELQPSELVVTILISELASVPMQETGIPLTNGVIPIMTLIACEILMSEATLKSLKFRRYISGSPSVIIRDGRIDQKEMGRLRYTVDDLMEELRLCGYMGVDEVACAVLETNGKLSVFPKCENKPATAGMLNLDCSDGGMPVTIICDGAVIPESLSHAGRDFTWLQKELQRQCVTQKDIFLLTVDGKGKMLLIKKEKENEKS